MARKRVDYDYQDYRKTFLPRATKEEEVEAEWSGSSEELGVALAEESLASVQRSLSDQVPQ
jgi:hypothetical protein